MNCPLCGYEFDETALTCAAACPMAQVQGCNLVCCPNCGYQMVDERKSGLAQFLRRALKIPGREERSSRREKK
jgi:predicted Zn-ribbon and HTH transcriptional regulator